MVEGFYPHRLAGWRFWVCVCAIFLAPRADLKTVNLAPACRPDGIALIDWL